LNSAAIETIHVVVWDGCPDRQWVAELHAILRGDTDIKFDLQRIIGPIERKLGRGAHDMDIVLFLVPATRASETASALRRLRAQDWGIPIIVITDAAGQALLDILAGGA